MDSGEKKNILVVDDDREIVRAIALNLESEGYNVFKAYDGMEALDLAMTKDIHLIIIDVMMPKLDGLSAIMKIRERKNLPIIVLSAKSEDSDKVIGPLHGRRRLCDQAFQPHGAHRPGKIPAAAVHLPGGHPLQRGKHHCQRAAVL